MLAGFPGEISQLPPMYSAVKHGGERLYKLARQGIEVERQPRRIQIFALDLVAFELPEIELDVHCSKGTYVRTLAEDIGQELGCGGHVIALRRTGVGPYDETAVTFVTLDQLRELADQEGAAPRLDALLLPLESPSGTGPRCGCRRMRPSTCSRARRSWCPRRRRRAWSGSTTSPSASWGSARSWTTARYSPSV